MCGVRAYLASIGVIDGKMDRHCIPCISFLAGTLAVITTRIGSYVRKAASKNICTTRRLLASVEKRASATRFSTIQIQQITQQCQHFPWKNIKKETACEKRLEPRWWRWASFVPDNDIGSYLTPILVHTNKPIFITIQPLLISSDSKKQAVAFAIQRLLPK